LSISYITKLDKFVGSRGKKLTPANTSESLAGQGIAGTLVCGKTEEERGKVGPIFSLDKTIRKLRQETDATGGQILNLIILATCLRLSLRVSVPCSRPTAAARGNPPD
jgi:hypothetical protein